MTDAKRRPSFGGRRMLAGRTAMYASVAVLSFAAGLLVGRSVLADAPSVDQVAPLGVSPSWGPHVAGPPPSSDTGDGSASTSESFPAGETLAGAAQAFTAAAPPDEAVALLDGLTVTLPDPSRPQYARARFDGWADIDGDCQDTRAEVLLAESLEAVEGRCTVRRGRWASPYEGGLQTQAAMVEIDHLVPLGNAWDAGAWRWPADRLAAYMNDVEHPEHLVAVTGTVNASKGNRSPDRWMIPSREQTVRCAYLTNWTVVKARWELTVTPDEADTLRRGLRSQC
jgi:hypothetical protein